MRCRRHDRTHHARLKPGVHAIADFKVGRALNNEIGAVGVPQMHGAAFERVPAGRKLHFTSGARWRELRTSLIHQKSGEAFSCVHALGMKIRKPRHRGD